MDTNIAVIDTETTGLEITDQVVEVAAVELPSWETWTTLVVPGVPISLEARAVHHILDHELREAPTVKGLVIEGLLPWTPEHVMACHNLEFDLRMLLQSGFPEAVLPGRKICTWRCSLHLFPDSPSHSNQVLRYYLDVKVPHHDGPPHRALPDALVTAAVLSRMLRERTVEELVELTTRPALLSKVPFGKSRGRPWSEMDRGFLMWVLDPRQTFNADVKHTARHWAGWDRQSVGGR
jgi:exodeoxyribonuclease X